MIPVQKALLAFVLLIIHQSLWANWEIQTSPLVRSNNAFAIDLYVQLAKHPGNFVFTPSSIATVLAMTSAGAKGNTAREMAAVLHRSSGSTNFHAEFSAYLNQLKTINLLGVQFLEARSVWTQRGYPFLKPFQELLLENYHTSLNEIDLTCWQKPVDSQVAAAARQRINDWTATQTEGKIMEILPMSLPKKNTRLILVDAVHFKGSWASRFDIKRTENRLFRVSTTKSVSVPTMHLKGQFRLYPGMDDFEALQLPYVSNRVCMLILLPKTIDGLTKLEGELATPRFAGSGSFSPNQSKQILVLSLIEQACQLSSTAAIDVALPRFSEDSSFDLKQPLMDMGMSDAFGEAADFSGITLVKQFWIDSVIQKASLTVDEQGTEAAAATTLDDSDSMGPTSFTVDHPFIFLIRDNLTGAILFMGRVNDPKPE